MTEANDRVLQLKFHGRILDSLGIHMYQSPVIAIAELIANAWDADAETVELVLPADASESALFTVKDDGIGMSFEECQDRYLFVGWNRRGDEPDERSPEKDRPILGRKGLGKFAGFGIADVIKVKTTCKRTGEVTEFQLDKGYLIGDEYISTDEKVVPVLDYKPPSKSRISGHGTEVTLSGLKISRALSQQQFARSMARRFLLHQGQDDFQVLVNGEPLPESFDLAGVEYVFPRDYTDEQVPENLEGVDSDGWGVEELEEGRKIRWRFLFHRETIDEEELRGVTIFAKGKLAQKPFLFNLTGGLGGQHAVEYLTGQVEADFVDLLSDDVMSSERERINWEHGETQSLLEWGQNRVRELLRIWRDRRGEKRLRQLEDKVARFTDRLSKLPPREERTVKRALKKLADITTLSDVQFEELGGAILTSWEQGRLLGLIDEIARGEELTEQEFLDILLEAKVLTALNIAEAVKTKLSLVLGLQERIERRDIETAVRDYLAENPELIDPEFETFQKERRVTKIIKEAAQDAKLDDIVDWRGRVDLALSGGDRLLIMEFMRPGLKVDWDHIERFDQYVTAIRTRIAPLTALPLNRVIGYLVADELHQNPNIIDRLMRMARDQMFALDWETLLKKAESKWKEFLDVQVSRAPEDERLRALINE